MVNQIKNWVNTRQISSATQKDNSTIFRQAEKQKWTKRKRKGRGGGYEYLVDELPQNIQQALAKRDAEQTFNSLNNDSAYFLAGKTIAKNINQNKELSADDKHRIMENGAAQLMQLQGKKRLKTQVKLTIIAAHKTFLVPWIAQNQKVSGEKMFEKQYNNRELNFDPETYQTIKQVSWKTIRRWVTLLESEGAGSLGGRYASTRVTKINSEPQMLEMAQGLIYHEPEIGGCHLREMLIAHSELNDLHWTVPSESKVRVWIRKFKTDHPLLVEKLNNPDDFKNRRQVSWGKADGAITHINQLWELDSTPSDVHLTDGRYSIIGMIDVFSRRPIMMVYPTSSAEAVCLLMRKAMLKLGVPEAVKTDNGKDYLSKRFKTTLVSLGIQQIVTGAFRGDEKPHIERMFGTWSHGISMYLPGYGGHDVAAREKLQARASFADRIMKKGSSDIKVEMSSTELQTVIDDWIEDYYNHKVHGTTKQKPLVRWHSQHTTIRTINNERALDILLSPVTASSGNRAGIRTVNKDVGLSVDGFSYLAVELGPIMGQKVFCSYNPENIGEIYVFNSTQLEFICKAQCPELMNMGMSRAELSFEAKKQQTARIIEQKKALKKAKNSVKMGDAARNVIAAAKKRNTSVIGMPLPTAPANSGLLVQASFASDLTEVKPSLSPENFQKLRQQQLDMDKARAAVVNAKPRFANDYEEYSWLLQQRKIRQLTPSEIVTRETYRKINPKWAKQAEAMVGVTDTEETKVSK